MAESEKPRDKSAASAPEVAKGEGAERRAFERQPVESVHGIFLSSIDARVVNVSLDGIAVETHHYLQVGREYSLELHRGDDALSLQGKVVWCSLVRTTKEEQEEILPVYRAGIHLKEVLSDTASDLYQFLEENAVIRLEKRVFGRFKTKSDESADVQYEARFAVKMISQSGMSIQTDIVPEFESVVELQMQLDGKLFQTSGRIVHVQRLEKREGEDRPRVEVGIEFVDLGAASRQVLEQFIGHRPFPAEP